LRSGRVDAELRRRLAQKAFARTAEYDAAIAAYLARPDAARPEAGTPEPAGARETAFAAVRELRLTKVQELRYGENPDQPAAFYAEQGAPAGALPHLRQLQGKELSFNNLLDIEAATFAVSA